METENIALIPSYKPDSRLISTAKELLSSGFNRVVVVNDGSGAGYQDIFSAAQKLDGVCVVTHTVNMGKGRALKTGFNFILERFPGCCAVAVDGDGQHRVCDAMSAAKYADLHPDALILGCRNFSKTENIPLANYLGNVLTRITVWLLTGLWFSDTQCGLRAYPPDIMRALCDVPGDRFEFENNTLLNIRTGGMKCVEFPITVNYEKKGQICDDLSPRRRLRPHLRGVSQIRARPAAGAFILVGRHALAPGLLARTGLQRSRGRAQPFPRFRGQLSNGKTQAPPLFLGAADLRLVRCLRIFSFRSRI